MTFDPQDFPLYEVLLKQENPGIIRMRQDFNRAVNGSDADKYDFALGIQTVAADESLGRFLPAATDAVRRKTLEKCLEVFEEVGSRGHALGAWMASYYHLNGIGCAQDFEKAAGWNEKAEALGYASTLGKTIAALKNGRG